MTKKQVKTIGFVLTAIVAYVLGGVIGVPGVNPTLLGGDLNQSAGKNTKVVTDEVKAFQKRLQTDKEFCEKTTANMALINTRASEFSTLVETAADIAKDIEPLSEVVSQLQAVKEMAQNACATTESAMTALNVLVKGNGNEGYDFEQLSQAAIIDFMLLEKQVNVGKEFVEAVDKYMQGKDVNEYMELAMARDLWMGYCASAAGLNNNEEEMAYWDAKQSLSGKEMNNTDYGKQEMSSVERELARLF